MRGLRPVCNGFLIKLKKPIKPTVLVSFLKKYPVFPTLYVREPIQSKLLNAHSQY